MYRSNKRHRIEQVPDGVSLKTWVREVQETEFVLGKIEKNGHVAKDEVTVRSSGQFIGPVN